MANQVTYNLEFVDEPMKLSSEYYSKLSFQTKGICEINVYENALVYPSLLYDDGTIEGGVYDSNGNFVLESSQNELLVRTNKKCIDNITFFEESVVFIGQLRAIWGHFITDSISRMWFLQQANTYQSLKFVFIGDPIHNQSSNYLELFECLGIQKENLIHITEPTRFKQVVLPDKSLRYDSLDKLMYREEFKGIINQILQYCALENNSQSNEKIYLTRSKLSSWRDIGELSIERLFRKQGFKIVSPEKLTFKQQIGLYQRCRTLASTEGSISHNSIFLKENSELILIRKSPTINPYSFFINELRSLKVSIIDCHLSIFLPEKRRWEGPFFLYVNRNLECFFGLKPSQGFNRKQFLKYFKFALYSGKFGFYPIDDYYFRKLNQEIEQSSLINKWKRLLDNFRKRN